MPDDVKPASRNSAKALLAELSADVHGLAQIKDKQARLVGSLALQAKLLMVGERVAELEAALRDIQKHIETTGGSGYARLSGTWNIAQKALSKGNSDA